MTIEYLNFTNPTKPVVADFAWINQGTATGVDDADGIYLHAPATGAVHDIHILKKSAPSTPYTITAFFAPNVLGVNYHSVGLCWRQSSDGKLVTLNYYFNTNPSIAVYKFTDESTYSAAYLTLSVWKEQLAFFRIEDDGTDRTCYVSMDGVNFIEIHTIGRTDFLTADEVGFFVNPINATYPCGMKLYHWLEA